MPGSLVLLLLSTLLAIFRCTAITISNTSPRRNATGAIIDAHDGSYQQWGGPGTPFYYYAMGYGACKQGQALCNGKCGYGYSWIGIWRSENLATNGTWDLVTAEARQPQWPEAVYFRVHVVYKESSKQYVMWVNVDGSPECPQQQCGVGQVCACYFVGLAASPDGPFEYKGASTARYVGPGDFDILVEGDDAFIIYTATQQGHVMSVEKLSDDWLKTLSPIVPGTVTPPPDPAPNNVSSGVIGNKFVEAPVIFQRKGTYYALFGECCCFCEFGSGAVVYTASHPLGPWTQHKNIGCSAQPKTGCGCGMDNPLGSLQCPSMQGDSVTKAQQNFIIQVNTANGVEYLWNGDMWQSSPDGIKAHDLQFTYPLQWKLDAASGLELPQPIQWLDSFEMDIL